MSVVGWAVVENIVIMAVMCFLVWHTGSGWWWLMLLLMNQFKVRDLVKNESQDRAV